MSKEEIEKDAREIISSQKNEGHQKSFSDRVDEELAVAQANKAAAESKDPGEGGTLVEENPQPNEADAQPSEGGAGGDPGDEQPVVPEPGPLSEADLALPPEAFLEDKTESEEGATEGEAEKPQAEIVEEMGADKVDEPQTGGEEGKEDAGNSDPVKEPTPDPAPDHEEEKVKREEAKDADA